MNKSARSTLILASKSPIRSQLLTNAGLHHAVEKPDIDERLIESELSDLTNEALAIRLATAKAMAVSHLHPQTLCLGADQILDLAGTRLHQPKDRRAAKAQLMALSGKTHTLISGFALVENGDLKHAEAVSARLTMHTFGEDEADILLDQDGDNMVHCVGSYRLEGPALRLFSNIEGDYFTILGLPMLQLLDALRRLNHFDPVK